jgi:ABC-type transport system substrate-binding protein
LTRLNLTSRKNDALLLKALPDVSKSPGQITWNFSIRTGLKWWDGSSVVTNDLAAFLKSRADVLLKNQSLKYTLKTMGTSVQISWPEEPPFAPLQLTSAAFFRPFKSSPLGFQCAGLYKIDSKPTSDLTRMQASPGYQVKYSTIDFLPSSSTKKSPFVSFEYKSKTDKSSSKHSHTCSAIELPIVSAIQWNPRSVNFASPKARQAMTYASPRGEVLRSVAGNFGGLISAPIPRSHPGYNSKVKVLPYDLKTASDILSQIGFQQKSIGDPRLDSAGKPMKIKIGVTNSTRFEIVIKMLTDSFASIGIESEFIDLTDMPTDYQTLDGILGQFSLPWPSMDFLESEAKTSPAIFPFGLIGDTSLDQLMVRHRASLAVLTPSFDALSNLHLKLQELEPWTVLMSHNACVVTTGLNLKRNPNTSEPDWFRQLILN